MAVLPLVVRFPVAVLLTLLIAAVGGAAEPFTVTPLDLVDADGKPDVVDVDSRYYQCRFSLRDSGSADSLIYKPLQHQLRAENYYSNRLMMFRDWVRLADPDPLTGYTRNINTQELTAQSRQLAAYRVVRQDQNELVLQFEIANSTEAEQPWMAKILNRRRILLRNDTPAIRVENEIVNTDTAEHSVVFDVYNGIGLGRVETCLSLPGAEGKVTGIDQAEEKSSQFIFASQLAGDWLGGVNAQGLGVAFSYEWPDIDGMQGCMYKTVGSAYHVVMRRRQIPPGQSITFRYTFMPLTSFGALDGVRHDLAGGILVGQGADYKTDVASNELKPGAAVPLRIGLASGRDRQVRVDLHCVRQEDGQVVLDRSESVCLRVATTETLVGELRPSEPGLYVLKVTADDGAGTTLTMEKPLEVGRTKLVFAPTPPAGEKRGKRDAGEMLGPAMMDPQFRTLDLSVTTPHLPLLGGHAKGLVRAMFLTSANSTLAHVREIAERSDLAVEYYAAGKVTLPKGELNPRALTEFRKQFHQSNCQVLVTLGVDWHVGLKARLSQEILARVRDGMGVVLMAADLKKQPELTEALGDAQPLPADDLLPVTATNVPPVRRWELGKGRVAVIECLVTPGRDEGRTALGQWTLLQAGSRPVAIAETKWRGFEYAYARLAQLIRWAAAQDSALTIGAAAMEGDRVTIDLVNAGQPMPARLAVQARTRRWDVRTGGSTEVQVPAGRSRHSVNLRSTPDGGPLALEIELRDTAKKILAFASAGAQVPSSWELSVTPQPIAQAAGKPAKFAVQLRGKDLHGRMTAKVIDRFGRLVFQCEQAVNEAATAGKTTVEFAMDPFTPLAVYHEIIAEWYPADASGRLAIEASADLFLLPAKAYYADRFAVGLWGAPERDALQIQGCLSTVHELGMTLFSHSYNDSLLYASGGYKTATVNLSIHDRYNNGKKAARLDSQQLIMEPPLLPDDEAVQAAKNAWQARATKEYASGARLAALDDERRISDDFDFHPQTLTGFRRWLAERYANIGELNRTWGSAFADFSQVVPKRREELGDSPNLAPWLDFRMFIGYVLGEFYMKRPSQWAAEIAPDLSVGEWGIYEPSVNWPVDWSQYAACYQFTARYGDKQGVLEELLRSFAPRLRHGSWMGYGMLAASPERRIAPWQSLLNGGNFCWFWEMRDSGALNYAVLASDLRPTAGYAALANDEFPDLTGGIDRIVLAGKFLDDRIALAYSYPSWIAEPEALARTSKVVIEELGYQHRFVNLEDVPRDILAREGYKLLVVQRASCISSQQRAAIAAFVQSGGTLLCLGRAGWRDLHGAPHADGSSLDELTGVATDRAAPLGRVLEVGGPAQSLCLNVASKQIAVTSARLLAAADLDGLPLPVLTERTLGRGKVYWLNSSLEGHQAIRRGGVANERSIALGGPAAIRRSHWQLFERIVRAAGIEPRCRFLQKDQPVFDTETWYYATPSGRSLLVAHYLSEEHPEPLTVRLNRKGCVYELRTAQCFGRTDSFEETFPLGVMRLYLVLDYQVKGLTAAVDRATCKPGDDLRLRCAVQADQGSPDFHAFRIQMRTRDGRDLPAYRMVVAAPNGEATVLLPIALNQPAGKYGIRVVDAVSGVAAETEFEVAASR